MRIWAGKQKKGAVVEGKWKGAEPFWNIGLHIRSEEVQVGLKVSEVENCKIENYQNEINEKLGIK